MTHICIVGGGTAGWLAALWITRLHPGEFKVTVVESSKIGIIGTGEGTTGQFFNLVQNRWADFGLEEGDFMRSTLATQKMGIRFHNWRGNGASYIAPIDNTPSINNYDDFLLAKHCLVEGPEQMHTSTICGTLAEHNLADVTKNWQTTYGYHAYHFDGVSVGRYFRHLVERDCTVIDAEVLDFDLGAQGQVQTARLSTGQTVTADYWIDCTGFARIVSKRLEQKWISYSDHLLCDRALPFQIKWDNDSKIAPLTEARAHSAGWQWQIPVQGRWGCGMVYSSAHQTTDQAVAELSQHWGRDIVPVKEIKFDPGRLDRPFYRNVMSLGLSANFLEPLQATNIHLQLTQLQCWENIIVSAQGQLDPAPAVADQANKVIVQVMDQFADLIQLHYRSGRTDTEFWRDNQHIPLRPQVAWLQAVSQRRWSQRSDWDTPLWGGAGYSVFIYPMIDYGYFNWSKIQQQLPLEAQDYHDRWQQHVNSRRLELLDNTEMVRNLQTRMLKLAWSREWDQIRAEPRSTLRQQALHPLLFG